MNVRYEIALFVSNEKEERKIVFDRNECNLKKE